MATESDVQQFVHRLEEGSWATWIKFATFVAFSLALAAYFVFWNFSGLADARAMEQAQMARELASGHGFSTKELRPAALSQIQHKKGDFPDGLMPDTYQAPLHSLVLAPFLLLTKAHWKMSLNEVVYVNDRMIAGVDTAFFLLAVVLSFLLLRRLFDTRLAVMVAAMLILCDRLWEFALTGLPQMLMLLLFSGAVYLLARAIEAHEAKRNPLAWLIACAFLFGLLGLTHAMTFFIFGACVLFVALYFRPWWLAPVIMVSIVVLMYLPWMIRNYHVCGSPFGVAYMALFDGMRGSEDTIMRSFGTDFGGIQPYFYRNKLITGFIDQTNNIFGYYGGLIVAPFFLMSLMHNFRRRETQMLKWAVLMMWLGGVFGMCLFGAKALPLNPNDLHLLFIPLFTGFGLAFLLVLWSRLEITFNLARLGFLAVLYIVSLMPMENELLGTEKNKVHWPPYVPPFISILREWSNSDDIIASDMPWAVGWYADRKSLWLPTKMSDLINLHDYEQLHGPIIGIYLTPITGNLPFVSDVLRGEYADWAPLILRQVNFRDFPFNAVTPLPLENQCVFYADHDRWTKRSD